MKANEPLNLSKVIPGCKCGASARSMFYETMHNNYEGHTHKCKNKNLDGLIECDRIPENPCKNGYCERCCYNEHDHVFGEIKSCRDKNKKRITLGDIMLIIFFIGISFMLVVSFILLGAYLRTVF